MYEIDPASVFSSIVCPMTKLNGSQVSDCCPLGYLSKIFFSEIAWPIKAKLYVEPPREGETKVCINGPGHLTMTAMLIYTGVNQKVLPVLSTETLLHIWLSTEYYGFRPSSTAVDTVS